MESLLEFKDLSDEQQADLKERAEKVAKNENLDVETVYKSFQRYFFAECAGYLHFAIFHPISMLDYEP